MQATFNFILSIGLREPTQSHPVPHKPSRGDERAHAVHALQPVSSSFLT